jgi:hypothetical protein
MRNVTGHSGSGFSLAVLGISVLSIILVIVLHSRFGIDFGSIDLGAYMLGIIAVVVALMANNLAQQANNLAQQANHIARLANRISRQTNSDQTTLQLRDDFYSADPMPGYRREAARELMQAWSNKSNRLNEPNIFDYIGDSLDDVGLLVIKGAVDRDLVWTIFFDPVTKYWNLAEGRFGYVTQVRNDNPTPDGRPDNTIWQYFEHLVNIMYEAPNENNPLPPAPSEPRPTLMQLQADLTPEQLKAGPLADLTPEQAAAYPVLKTLMEFFEEEMQTNPKPPRLRAVPSHPAQS